MKKKNIILYFVLSIFGFQSCEVTDRVPIDDITDLNYWTKVDDLWLWARYFYPNLSGPPGGSAGYHDGTSDITVPLSAPGSFFDTRIVPTGSDGWASGDWANIRRCNYFMTRYHTVQGDLVDINHYVGEIRFFRANEYFEKVKRFGDVPWFEKDLQTTDTELLYKGRDPRLFVIGKIIEDLEFATENMKLPSQVSTGQLHRYCAYQMLARVCLFEATWQKYRDAPESVWKPLMEKAAAAAKTIMDINLYSIEQGTAKYIMNDDHPLMYKSKFIQESLVADKECILARIYIKDVIMNYLGRNFSYGLSKDFVEQFLDIDGIPIALSSKYRGDDSIAMEIQNRDPRMWNIINNRHVPFTLTGTPPAPKSNLVDMPGGTGGEQNATGYVSTKFRDPNPEQWNAGSTTTDWYIFRYAETLLIYAEAMFEMGQCTQAVLDLTINKLRARLDYTDAAGNRITMGRLTTTPAADPMAISITGEPRYGYIISPLLYEIRRERCIELAFEGRRWEDICRWKAGKLINNPKTMWGIVVNSDVIAFYTENNGGTNPFRSSRFATITDWDGKTKTLLRVYTDELEKTRAWKDKYYLDPLPQTQMTLNPNILPQNPGWD